MGIINYANRLDHEVFWMPVEDILPDKDGEYLIAADPPLKTRDTPVTTAFYWTPYQAWFKPDYGESFNVVAWAPLPLGPAMLYGPVAG